MINNVGIWLKNWPGEDGAWKDLGEDGERKGTCRQKCSDAAKVVPTDLTAYPALNICTVAKYETRFFV